VYFLVEKANGTYCWTRRQCVIPSQAETDKRKDITIPSDAPSELHLQKHIDYILSWTKNKTDYEYVVSEHLRMNGVYWCVTAMHIMRAEHLLDKVWSIE
jgi:prenyltransferase beta subunit